MEPIHTRLHGVYPTTIAKFKDHSMDTTYVLIALAVVMIATAAHPALIAVVCLSTAISTALDVRAHLIRQKGHRS